jgi:hypothetical protein
MSQKYMTTASALAIALLLAGCAKPWNTANTALEAAAMAAAATDELVAANMGGDHETARARVVEEARAALAEWEACGAAGRTDCGARPTVEQFMAEFRADEAVARWETATLALEELREALIIAQAGVTIWRDTQEEPGNWSTICAGLHTTQGAVVRAIEATGVEVPNQYETALNQLGTVCTLVVTATVGD